MADLKATATQIRRDIVRMVHGCQSGHPGGSLGCADFLTALYFKVLKHDPSFHMDGKNEDLFFLSNVISLLYFTRHWRDQAILTSKNWRLSEKSTPVCKGIRLPMNTFRVYGSPAVHWVRG